MAHNNDGARAWRTTKQRNRADEPGEATRPGTLAVEVAATPLNRGEAHETAEKLHVLFVCSRNQWRSPTAERLWKGHPRVVARSAGTSSHARHRVSAQDIEWAHVVIVMEQKHKSRIMAEFSRLLESAPVHVLHIPDEYRYMDPALVEELNHCVGPLLGEPQG